MDWEKRLEPFKLLVFDFDGTLVNLSTDWNSLRSYYCDLLNIDDKNTNFRTLLSQMREEKNKEIYNEALQVRTQAEKEGFSTSHINHDLVSYIKTSQKICTVFSMNTEKAIRSILQNLNILDKFEKIIGGDSISPPKPDPTGLKTLITDYKMDRRDVVMIGDSDIDENCAHSAQTEFIRVDYF